MMPQLPPEPPAVDPGNQILAECPAQLFTSLVQTPQGQRMVLTIRTTSATVSVLLGADDAKAWAGNLNGAAARMSKAGLIVANGHGS